MYNGVIRVLDRSLYGSSSRRSCKRDSGAVNVSGCSRSVLWYLRKNASYWITLLELSEALNFNPIVVKNTLDYLCCKKKVVRTYQNGVWRYKFRFPDVATFDA